MDHVLGRMRDNLVVDSCINNKLTPDSRTCTRTQLYITSL